MFLNDDYFQLNTILQSLINGLSNGVLYAFLALALVFIYKTSAQLNFAQGEMAMVGAFIVFQVMLWTGMPLWAAVPIAMAVMFLIGAASWRYMLRPVVKRGGHAPMIVLLGVFLLLNAGSAVIWGTSQRQGLSPLPNGLNDKIQLLGGVPDVHINFSALGGMAILLVTFGALELWLRKTRMGLGYRAITSNPDSAESLGIDRNRYLTIGWGISAAIGVLVGMLFSQQSGLLHSNLMLNGLLFGFAAAALGGFDSLFGAIIGGLIIGLLEATIPNAIEWIGPSLNVAVALMVIFLVLVFRPSGLFGSTKVVRP
ncbi:branched-chain amino acid ABC transporter permease [Paeniglutamicibacter sp. MACA_103]|uniref:branched-chain amino acid ABC transporter permease n=1 Tax=Paeniglutamicibacter sp. MACA_103 TaxID=3377337 RepID=UPI003892EAB1